jgi:predicted oxidoreductase
MMDRVQITEDLSFSRLVYGMWRLADDTDTGPAHVRAKVEACLEQGITTFDQADIYGAYTAEGLLGAALKDSPGLRDQMEIVTKCDIVAPIGMHSDKPLKYYDTSRDYIHAAVDRSLTEMGIDVIDLLLIHRPDPLMDHHETGAALDDLVYAGKVRTVGVSNFRPWDFELLQSAMSFPLVTNQIEISLSQIGPFTNGDLAFHQRQGHPVMAWSPLGGGGLMTGGGAMGAALDEIAKAHGADRAAVAVAFLLRHPATIMPVLGTNTLGRIASIHRGMHVDLDRHQWFRLYEAALGHEVS